MNSTTSSLRSSCSCCAIGASLHVLCGNVSCHAAVRNVDPVRSVMSAGLSHANITSYASLQNKYSKTACVGQVLFSHRHAVVELRHPQVAAGSEHDFFRCATNRACYERSCANESKRPRANPIDPVDIEFTSFYYAVRLLHVPNLVFARTL